MEQTTIRQKVEHLLNTAINPAVAMHGGMIQLVDVRGTVVYIQMAGGCHGCGAADVTLKAGVEKLIKEEIPEVTQVLDATDHASGQNPYFAPPQ